MTYKKCLRAVFGILLLLVPAIGFSGPAYADNFSTSFECAGSVVHFSAVAPGSVTKGASFNITNISSSSTAPPGFTVNQIVSTDMASNATPASSTGTWNGTGTGSFTVTYPDQTLTATGAAGSKITVTISSVVIYISGLSSPVTCDAASGLLTANAPGESLTLETINIVAPSASPSATAAPKTTAPAAPTPAATTTPVAPTTSDTTMNNTVTTGSATIVVQNSSGHAIKGAKVTLDSRTSQLTNASGTASFSKLLFGNHAITVSYGKKTAAKTFLVNAINPKEKVTVQVNTAGFFTPVHLAFVGLGLLLLLLAAAAAGYWFIFRKRKPDTQPQMPAAPDVAPPTVVPPVSVMPSPAMPVSPGPTVVHPEQPPSAELPPSAPPSNNPIPQ